MSGLALNRCLKVSTSPPSNALKALLASSCMEASSPSIIVVLAVGVGNDGEVNDHIINHHQPLTGIILSHQRKILALLQSLNARYYSSEDKNTA